MELSLSAFLALEGIGLLCSLEAAGVVGVVYYYMLCLCFLALKQPVWKSFQLVTGCLAEVMLKLLPWGSKTEEHVNLQLQKSLAKNNLLAFWREGILPSLFQRS